jgi:hypothetical protein
VANIIDAARPQAATSSSPIAADTLLKQINAAMKAANKAEAALRETLVSCSKKNRPAKDFEAFLQRVDGLQLSRAYDCMRVAGGRTTNQEIRKATKDRVQKHRENPHSLRWRLSYGVRIFCGVEIYRHPHRNETHFIGLPSDVEFARWLLDSLADFVFAELYGDLIGCPALQSERRIVTRSFADACCS